MRFIVDANLPPWLARRIEGYGHHAQHVSECLSLDAKDFEIIETAKSMDAAIVTKDGDFAELIAKPPPGVLWIRAGNLSNSKLHLLIEAEFAKAVLELEQGAAVVEIR